MPCRFEAAFRRSSLHRCCSSKSLSSSTSPWNIDDPQLITGISSSYWKPHGISWGTVRPRHLTFLHWTDQSCWYFLCFQRDFKAALHKTVTMAAMATVTHPSRNASQLPVSSPQIQGLVAQTGTSEPWLCTGIKIIPSTSGFLTGKGKSLPKEGKERGERER